MRVTVSAPHALSRPMGTTTRAHGRRSRSLPELRQASLRRLGLTVITDPGAKRYGAHAAPVPDRNNRYSTRTGCRHRLGPHRQTPKWSSASSRSTASRSTVSRSTVSRSTARRRRTPRERQPSPNSAPPRTVTCTISCASRHSVASSSVETPIRCASLSADSNRAAARDLAAEDAVSVADASPASIPGPRIEISSNAARRARSSAAHRASGAPSFVLPESSPITIRQSGESAGLPSAPWSDTAPPRYCRRRPSLSRCTVGIAPVTASTTLSSESSCSLNESSATCSVDSPR